jgi:predicted dehydrogenase
MKIALIEVSHWHAPLYFEAFESMELRITAVTDQNPEIAARAAKRLGCKADVDYKRMIQQVQPDFVFAFGRHRDMPEIAAYLINENIPFAMEKPMGISLSDVEDLRLLAEQKAAFIAVPFVFRYSPINDAINDLRATQEFGEITNGYFRFIAGPPSRYTKSDNSWLLDQSLSGGGCTINLGVHFLDFSLSLLGMHRVDRVYAVTSSRKYNTPVEDFSTVVLSTKDDIVCTIETGYAYPSDQTHPRHFEFCLNTTKGYMEIHEGEYIWAGHNGSRIERKIVTDTDLFYPMFVKQTLNDFARGKRPTSSVKEMAAVMELIDAVYLSGRERRAVSI